MKKMKLVAFLVLVLFAACKKNFENQTNNLASNVFSNFGGTTPQVDGGMLSFPNLDDYEAWLEYVDNSVRRDTTEVDTTDTVTTYEIMTQIEQDLGFYSLRKKLDDEFEILNQTGWASLDDIPVMHHIGDQTVLSTLNDYSEVKIGGKIYCYHYEGCEMVIEDETLLPSIHAVLDDPGSTIDDIHLIDDVEQGVNITFAFDRESGEGTAMLKPTGADDYKQVYGPVMQVNPCSPTVQLSGTFGIIYKPTNTWVNAQYTVNWGDGNNTLFFSTKAGQNHIVQHTYASYGLKQITITAYISALNLTFRWTPPATNVFMNCQHRSRNSGYVWKATPDNARATRGYISVTNNGAMARVYGSTEAYKKSNNTWKKRKADRLRVEACGEILQPNCSPDFNKCGITERRKDKFVQDGFNVGRYFKWVVIYGNNKIQHNGTWYNHHLPLQHCP